MMIEMGVEVVGLWFGGNWRSSCGALMQAAPACATA